MVSSMSRYIADFLLEKEVIEEDSYAVYVYGFEVIQAGVINVLVLILLSAGFGHMFDGICFFVSFCLLRKTCGGYHADTYLRCNIILGLNVTFVMLVIDKMGVKKKDNVFLKLMAKAGYIAAYKAAGSASIYGYHQPKEPENIELPKKKSKKK